MATQKKRRMDDDPAPELAGLNNEEQIGAQLPPHLREEPVDPQSKRIAQLEGTLKHLRGWMHHVQENMQANGLQKDTVFNARRLFVGGIPAGTVEAELTKFIAEALRNTGAAVSSTGQPISYCRIQPDKNFAFVEVRSAEEASNTMALDGIVFKDVPLKIKRPSKYDQSAAFLLGPTEPDPTIDLSVVEISRPPVVGLAGAPAGAEGEGPGGKYEATPNTLYIGGLPIEWSTDQCMELLKMYGEVKYFRLMMDRTTGNSRGFAFAEYTTDEATIAALAALDGAQLGPRRIAANRMLEHKQKQQGGFRQGAMGGGPGGAGGQWGNRAGGSGGMGRGGGMGMNAGRMGGYGGQQGGMAAGAGAGGDGMGGYGAMGGMHQGQGAAAAAGMQGQAAGYGMGGMGAGYGMGQQQQQQPAQQGYYGGAAAGGMAGAGMNAMNGAMNAQAGMAGAAAGGMGGYNAAQQGMYGMNQAGGAAAPAAAAAAAAGGGVYDGYGSQGQMQQGAGMYGNQMVGAQQQQQQPGMMAAAGAGAGLGMAAMSAAAAGGMGMGQAMGGMGAGYGQQQQEQQQQQGYAAGLVGMPQMGAGGQMGAGYAAGAQPVPPPRGADPAAGMGGGNMAAWAGQWPAGSQPMQNWG